MSLNNLYSECGLESLKSRRELQKYYFMYKVFNNLVPQYVIDLFPLNVSDINDYQLRNPENYTVPYSRTELMRKSCVPSAINLWNDLDKTIKLSQTFSSYKHALRSPNVVPSYFLFGNRFLSVLHARIRNNCSNLNADLFRNHISPSPLCLFCNTDEDAEHFFFLCPRYQTQRLKLFNETRCFHPLSVQLLLFGKNTLSIRDNELLFESVHLFIKDTKRFIR